MILEIGNMFDVFGDGNNLWVCSANSTLNKHGHLVMGKGLALQLKQRVPCIAEFFGDVIKRHYYDGGIYGFLPCAVLPEQRIGILQVKTHFRNRAELCLLGYSLLRLDSYAMPKWVIHLNYPCIGNGGRTEEEVLPLISELDDRFHVWKLR